MHKWTAPPVVVKDGAPLVPFNHYLEAVDEIQRMNSKLDRAGHLVHCLKTHLERNTFRSVGLLAAIRANNALNRRKETPTSAKHCQPQKGHPES